jgi:hypothetical protein
MEKKGVNRVKTTKGERDTRGKSGKRKELRERGRGKR